MAVNDLLAMTLITLLLLLSESAGLNRIALTHLTLLIAVSIIILNAIVPIHHLKIQSNSIKFQLGPL